MSAPCTCTIDSDGNFVADKCYSNDDYPDEHIIAAVRRIDAERQATTAQEDPALAPYPEDELYDLIAARDRVQAHRANFDRGDTRRTHWVDGFSCGWHARKLRVDAERQAVGAPTDEAPNDLPGEVSVVALSWARERHREWSPTTNEAAQISRYQVAFESGVQQARTAGPLLLADCGCELWADGVVVCDAGRITHEGTVWQRQGHVWSAFHSAFQPRPVQDPPELLRWAKALGCTPEVLIDPGWEAASWPVMLRYLWVDGAMQVTATLTETP